MKDLKHLYYFESLLQDANNQLVRQASAAGGIAVGYTCYHMPEVLLNLGRCFSVRLRAPRTGSMDIATYYMSNATCEYARALLERALEGGYRFLDCMAGVDVCECMNRSMENMELLGMTMRSHSNGGYINALDECWKMCEKFDANIVFMYNHVSCKNFAGLQGLFEDQARERGIHLIWVEHDLMDPRTVSRKAMRDRVNRYMRTVFRAEPLDPTLMDYDDDLTW